MNQASQDSGNGRKIALVVVLLLAAAGFTWWNSRPEVTPFHAIAYPCLPMDTVTTDPTQFIMVSGNRSPPTEHTLPDGRVVYPVYFYKDPTVVPLVGGKLLYFPVRFFDEDGLETPPLPPRNQPLPKMYSASLTRYIPEEAMQQLNAALQGTAP